MGFPSPQFGVPLSPNQISPELPFYPIYGVTPADKYIPIAVDNDGKLSIGDVTITGPVTISDVVIKGVDPANGNTSHDVSVVDWTLSGGGYALRTSLFYQDNPLVINNDGTIKLPQNAAQETGGNLDSINAGIETLNSLVPSVFDYIALSYTTGNLTQAVYKHGGAAGTVVSTLNIVYDGDNNITSVTRV